MTPLDTPLDRLRDDAARPSPDGFAETVTIVYKADLAKLVELADAARGYIAEFDAHESTKHTEKHRQYVRDALAALTKEDT